MRSGNNTCFQDKIVTQLPNEKVYEEDDPDEPNNKRPRLEVENDPAEEAEKDRRKQQNQEMFYYRDLLGEHCKKKHLYFMLKHNNQGVNSSQVAWKWFLKLFWWEVRYIRILKYSRRKL